MAKTVYSVEEVVLHDNTILELRPLTIKRHRQVLAIFGRDPEIDETLSEEEQEIELSEQFANKLLDMCLAIIEPLPTAQHIKTRDDLEDVADMDTVKYIIKVGTKLDIDGFLERMTLMMEKEMNEAIGANLTS